MKKSTMHQIVGVLVEAGRTDLAEEIVVKSESYDAKFDRLIYALDRLIGRTDVPQIFRTKPIALKGLQETWKSMPDNQKKRFVNSLKKGMDAYDEPRMKYLKKNKYIK